MQQFLLPIVVSAYLCSPTFASVLTQDVRECGSKVVFGDIDLSQPVKEAPPEPSQNMVVIVPIESALAGSLNAPTGYIGAARIEVPKGSAVDVSPDCAPLALP